MTNRNTKWNLEFVVETIQTRPNQSLVAWWTNDETKDNRTLTCSPFFSHAWSFLTTVSQKVYSQHGDVYVYPLFQMMTIMRRCTILVVAVIACYAVEVSSFAGLPTGVRATVHARPRSATAMNAAVELDETKTTTTTTAATYQPYRQRSMLERANGALYRQSVLPKDELETVRTEVENIQKKLHSESSSIAQYRLGAALPSDSNTVQVFQEGSLCQWVRKVTGDPTMKLSTNLPVEVRSYEKTGANMAWHVDDVLYDPPQVEVVFTLENTSDCKTMWKEEDDKTLHVKETDPNSVILLQAGGPLHCVTSLKRGKRIIVKCAYVTADAVFREGIHANQFQQAAIAGKTGKSKRGSRQ